MGAAQQVMRNITGKFYDHEMKAARKDEEFVSAANRLRELLLKALDIVDAGDASMGPAGGSRNSQGPTHVMGDSIAPALKSTRDAQGVRIKDGEPVQRDGYGRRIR